MHTSNDIFPGFIRPVIKIKIMLNDRIVKGGALKWRLLLAHLQKRCIKEASKQKVFR